MQRITRRLGAAASIGLVMAVAFGSPAAASELILHTGLTGDFGTNEPAAKCGYSASDSSGTAYLRWIKVFAVFAGARDTTGAVDQQPVRWAVTIQRSNDGGTTWKNVATSAAQTRTAYDNASATFDPIKVFVNGNPGQIFRAISTIKWIRNGSVEGKAKLRPEEYSVKWTVGTPDYVFFDACTGSAD